MIIAVDGPTASGKGTIAKALAAHYGLPHLDTGLLYRAVGRQVNLNHGNPDDPTDALAACTFPDRLLDDPELRSEACGGLASQVSVFKEMQASGRPAVLAEIAADLAARDLRDSTRSAAPLVAASDAVTLDTSALGKDAAIASAIALVDRQRDAKQG
ncbi:MAG: hypothetical protein RIQ99_1420 [Pseudomonadota bacterium]